MAAPEEKTLFQSPLASLAGVFAAALAAALSSMLLFPLLPFAQQLLPYAYALILAVSLICAAACLLVSRSIYCKISKKEFSLSSGILTKHTRSIPISHIDNFSVSRSPLQGLLGLGTLRIDTPGSYSYEAELADFPNSSISLIIDAISESHISGAKKKGA